MLRGESSLKASIEKYFFSFAITALLAILIFSSIVASATEDLKPETSASETIINPENELAAESTADTVNNNSKSTTSINGGSSATTDINVDGDGDTDTSAAAATTATETATEDESNQFEAQENDLEDPVAGETSFLKRLLKSGKNNENSGQGSLQNGEDESGVAANTAFHTVLYRNKPVFKIFYKDQEQQAHIATKARLASLNLESAMNASEPLDSKAKPIDIITLEDHSLEVLVRGFRITVLDQADQHAAGFVSLNEFKESLFADLNKFIKEETQRLHLQRSTLQFFLSLFFALVGFVVFHQVKVFFNHADAMIKEKKESLRPIVLMSETLVSAHALGWMFALFLVIGRVLAYIIVILTTVAVILGQFTLTRTAMSQLFSELIGQGIQSIQSLLESLPGIILALILFFCWHLSLKILDLFLKGVRSGRISWSFLQEHRIAVVRFWGTALSCVVFFPLIAASLFSRFNTPVETILLMGTGILILATLPLAVSIATGSFMIWQGYLEQGKWISISDKHGVITDISLYKFTVTPEDGQRVHVPMSQLLFKSFAEDKDYHKGVFQFKVQRLKPLDHTLNDLQKIFEENGLEVDLHCISLSSSIYHFSLSTLKASHKQWRAMVLKSLSDAHDKGRIQLHSEPIQEIII